tara:strand:+ start:2103 stop:2501 length:399 start_codon:yes stop_codon:yes gene_type:complete
MKQQAIERKDYKLPADFKKGWIDSLTSGEYEQIDGAFYEKGCGYCAIGVAIIECLSIDKSFLDGMMTLDQICEKYKIPYADVKIPWGYGSSDRTIADTIDLEDVIMEMNDGDGYSFNQIAEWIEDNVEEMEQ